MLRLSSSYVRSSQHTSMVLVLFVSMPELQLTAIARSLRSHGFAADDKLIGLGYRVWWDKACLEKGTRWEDGFVAGLASAAYASTCSNAKTRGCSGD